MDWLTPFLDGCKDYVDVASIHAYGFSGTQLSVNGHSRVSRIIERSYQT